MVLPANSTAPGIPSVTSLRTKQRRRRGHADFAAVHVAGVKAPRLHVEIHAALHASLHVASLKALSDLTEWYGQGRINR